jgi:hypothetical protein
MLEVIVEGRWATVCLWDNADAVDDHHEHEYTRQDGKQQPTTLRFPSVNQAMAAAVAKARSEWRAILGRWEGER